MTKLLMLLTIVFSVTIIGCATAIPYRAAEQCAVDELSLGGINHGSESASGLAYDNRGRLVTASASGSSSNVLCEVPRNDADRKQVSDIKRAMAPKEDYNRGLSIKKMITGVGYVAFVVPGIVMKFIYDGQYDQAVEKSSEIARQTPAQPAIVSRPPASN